MPEFAAATWPVQAHFSRVTCAVAGATAEFMRHRTPDKSLGTCTCTHTSATMTARGRGSKAQAGTRTPFSEAPTPQLMLASVATLAMALQHHALRRGGGNRKPRNSLSPHGTHQCGNVSLRSTTPLSANGSWRQSSAGAAKKRLRTHSCLDGAAAGGAPLNHGDDRAPPAVSRWPTSTTSRPLMSVRAG